MATAATKQEISLPQERHNPFTHEYFWPNVDIRVEVDRLEEDGQAEIAVHFQLWPLLEKGKATTIYAPGGSGKSYLSCYMALLVQTGCTGLDSDSFCFLPEQGNVLYLDCEGCREDHERRVWALKQGLGVGEEVTFLYRRCTRPLAADIQTIRNFCLEYDINLVIIDSQMAASGYGPDPAMQATLFYNAIRILTWSHSTGPGLCGKSKRIRNRDRTSRNWQSNI